MRLKPLYRTQFEYSHDWEVQVKGPGGSEQQLFLLAEGTVDGRIRGKFHGANYPRRRTDKTAVTDFRGAIECDDGAVILFEYRGFGRAHTPDHDRIAGIARRQWVATATHLSDDDRYSWLNDAVCVGTGQVGPSPLNPQNQGGAPPPGAKTPLTLDVAELIWEPPETP